MSVGFTNWAELGFFPLQDHEDGVPLGMRQQLAGGRIVSLFDPSKTDDPAETVHVVGTEDDMGTIGDLWPWAFWQTRDREERHTGMWAQGWAGISVEAESKGGPKTGPRKGGKPIGVVPIITSQHGVDGRMKTQQPAYPKSFSKIPQGWDLVVFPGTEETAQHLVQISADPRIVVANVGGSGECSTLFVDLQPDDHPCMAYAGREPGQDGRAARASSMMKVIPLNSNSVGPLGAGDYNGLAWNCALGKQERILGYGMCWIQMRAGGGQGPITNRPAPTGPITPRPSGPITQPPGSFAATGGEEGANKGDDPGGPSAESGNAGGLHDRDRETPDDWGEFSAKPQGGHGVTFMSAPGTFGPLDGGFGSGDKHYIGNDLDGNPMVSGHCSTNTYFVKDSTRDAPLEFGGDYPKNVKDAELKVRVYLDYDANKTHPWVQGNKPGLWRWWSTTHVCIPDNKPPNGDTPVPRVPTTPGPGTPVPTGPRTPGPGNPGTGNPTTPRNVPPSGGPITHGGPRYPHLPAPRGGSYGKPTTGPRGGGEPIVGGDDENENDCPKIVAQTVNEVGQSHGALSLFQVYHPSMEGFSAISFRPQRWTVGGPSTIHAHGLGADKIHCMEQTMPQVLAGHAFGGQDSAGELAYTQGPEASRARGGTADGGFMFSPPHLEPEDYFFETGLNPDTVVTTSTVLLAPGVELGFGKPKRTGAVDDGGFVVRQNPSDLTQLDVSRIVAGVKTQLLHATIVGTDPFVSFAGTGSTRLPAGTTAQRPSLSVDGETRVNTDTDKLDFYSNAGWHSTGSSDVADFVDLDDTPAGYGSSGDVVTADGVSALQYETPTDFYTGNPGELVRTDGAGLLNEFVTPAATPAFTDLPDTPSSYSGQALKLLRVNAGATAVEFAAQSSAVDHGSIGGLTDDDHTQYLLLTAGSGRALTGALYMGTDVYPTTTDWKQVKKMAGGGAAGDAVELVQAVAVFFPFTGGTITNSATDTTFSGGHVILNDNVSLKLGTSGGEGFIKSDGADLHIDPAGSIVKVADEMTVETSLAVGQTGVADASAALEIESTTKGLLLPRMTTTQMNSITKVAGLMIYNTTASAVYFTDGTSWLELAVV